VLIVKQQFDHRKCHVQHQTQIRSVYYILIIPHSIKFCKFPYFSA